MDREELLKLIQDDDQELLNIKPKPSTSATADERLLASFQEVNEFFRQNGREPQANKKDMNEMKLYSRLEGLREKSLRVAESLGDYDVFGLLGQHKNLTSINDIFNDDDLGILDDDAENIFNLTHVPPKEKFMPDYIARRKPCEDYDKFELLFKECQSDLSAGRRNLARFTKELQINKGEFFILNGILLYVAEEGERESSIGEKYNARLRCIFENGTECDMLLRSLAAGLYKDGWRVSRHNEKLVDDLKVPTNEDKETGYIYVLKSLSDRPDIKSLQHLYKIGFSNIPVEDRIKNAAQEPTFLMAPVSVVSVYRCYNSNPQKLELMLHTFFGSSCLNIDVFDSNRRRHSPREWFIAPLNIIAAIIKLIDNEEIVNYRYDPELQEIVVRS